jgi:drug/metabolite transporter (DMT)-like permease
MQREKDRQMNAREWAMLVTLSVLWGGSFLTAKIAVGQYSPMGLVFWRVFPAALLLGAYIFLTKKRFPEGREQWQALLGMSLLNNVIPMSLIFYGVSELASNIAAVLNATTPLFTVLVLHVLSKDEKASAMKIAGVVTGFIGVVVLLGVSGIIGAPLAILACLGAALSYGISGFWGKRFKTMKMEPTALAFGQLAVSSLILGVITAIFVPQTYALPQNFAIFISIVALAVLCTAVAYILFFKILNSAGATNIMLVTFLIPISAFIMGWIFLDEAVTLRHIAGVLLIGLGLMLIDGRVFKRNR